MIYTRAAWLSARAGHVLMTLCSGVGGSVLLEVEVCNPEGGTYSRDSHYITGTSGSVMSLPI